MSADWEIIRLRQENGRLRMERDILTLVIPVGSQQGRGDELTIHDRQRTRSFGRDEHTTSHKKYDVQCIWSARAYMPIQKRYAGRMSTDGGSLAIGERSAA
ncbi:hypothetical protein E4K64_36050 [Bradyrhizobium frederickii]|uniref:Transposase n=1 Tax=Bradyrhizobium frederickii TaxID=2560054 RepID=A0A4Y9NQP2_9BRAD|nr:hypothetical protein [Bradyrhizobium frederickii]TFV68685.1 hypothetical protein E4K64_36050 [Bradyrhizobium frederickii]